MSNAPKTGLRTKHWVVYMFGDWGGYVPELAVQSSNTIFGFKALCVPR